MTLLSRCTPSSAAFCPVHCISGTELKLAVNLEALLTDVKADSAVS